MELLLKGLLTTELKGVFVKLESPYNVKVTFSEAKFTGHSQTLPDTPVHVGMELMDLFVGVKEVFQHRLQKPQDSIEEHFSKPVGNAYNRFVKFLTRTGPVLEMLAEIVNDKSLKEAEFNVFVARNILQPLSGGQCLINNDHHDAVQKSRKQHGDKGNVFLPQEMNWGGLGMGYEDGFYGEPDLIVIPEDDGGFGTVFQNACAVTESESEEDEKEEEEEEEESSEPAYSSPSAYNLSQCLATAISFSKIQNQRHKELFSFPVIRIHPEGFDIVIYDCKHDLLYLKPFSWTVKSFAALWIVLHHKIFPIQFPPNIEKYSCGYLKVVQSLDMLPKGDGWYGVHKSELIVDEPTLIEREL